MSARDQLDSYLKQLENRLRLGVLLRGGAVVALVALTVTFVLVLIINSFAFSAASLLSARIVLLITLAAALAIGLALPLFRLNRRQAAASTEAAFPEFQQRLLTLAERRPSAREPFMELLAADALELARRANPARLISNRRLLLSVAAGSACLGILLWMILAGPGYIGYGSARLWAGSSGAPALYDIRVSPGNAAVRRNASQTVTAQLVGFESHEARLYARYQSASKWEQAVMQSQPAAAGFQFTFAAIPEAVEYYVQAGRLSSQHYRLHVIDPPSIKQIRVTYRFPAWTGLPSATEEHGGDLRAVEGTDAELEISTDRPLRDGVLVLDSNQNVALSGGQGNVYRSTVRIEKDGLYHVAAVDEGQRVRLSNDFFIEARKANPPEVHITRPAGDYRSSPIEEVTVSVKAADEYGLKDVSLHYSVNGGPERALELLNQKGLKEALASTTISLENFKLVPGDVVSLYAAAKDARVESRTDMFFIQAEPFEREYSQSQMAGGMSGGGVDQFEISQREKEIIAATWKQQGPKKASNQEASEAGKFLSGVQSKLRDQAISLSGRLEMRELTEESDEVKSFEQDMKAAADAMGPAADKLKRQMWKEAIPREQQALQALLRAEATFRRIEVAFGSRGGGAGTGRDLASLFDLELDTEKNQYETGQTASPTNQRNRDIDQAFRKLDELARREQELAGQERSPAGQEFQQRWQQEMLRREAEQLEKQMEQLAESRQPNGSDSASQGNGRSQGDARRRLQQALDQLRRANEDMRNAASPEQSQAAARRAADRLREASNLLATMQQQSASERLDSLTRRADRLAAEQRDQSERLRRMRGGKSTTDSSGQSRSNAGLQEQLKLAKERQRTTDDLARLRREMQDTQHELASAQRSAAQKLNDALGDMERAELHARLQRSADSIRQGTDPDASANEQAIAAGLQHLDRQVHEARQAMGPEQKGTEQTLAEVESLRRQIENLTRDLSSRNGRLGQLQQGQAIPQSESEGVGRSPAGGAHIETPGAERDPASDSTAPAPAPSIGETLRQLGQLRQQLRGRPEQGDVQELIQDLQRLGFHRFAGNPALVEQLRTQVLTSMDKLELQLRRELDDKESAHIREGDSSRVPAGYQNSVAEYFRRLSKNRQ